MKNTDPKRATKLLLSLLLIGSASVAVAVVPGDQAPAWQGTDLVSTAPVAFPEVLDGKPAILVFWATWCPYCKAFMPYAGEIQAEYAAHGVQLVTFNAKERGRGDPAAYVRSLNFSMVAIAAADEIAERYNVRFIPGLMVVDGTGKVVYRRRSTNLPAGKTVSAQWADEVREALDSLVKANQDALPQPPSALELDPELDL